MPYCTNCGSQVMETAKFCPECGSPQAARVAERATSPASRPRPSATIGSAAARGTRRSDFVTAGVMIGGLLLIGVLAASWREPVAATSRASTIDTRTAERIVDSTAAAALWESGELKGADLVRYEDYLHEWSFGLDHSRHEAYITTVLDSVDVLLKPEKSGRVPYAAFAVHMLAAFVKDPLSPAQEMRAAALREKARGVAERERAMARVHTIQGKASCSPSIDKVRRTIERHPDWGDRTLAAVVCGSVFVGMTAEQARAGWGAPSDINRTTNSYGTREQWVYGRYGGRGYLYFDDGVLTTIQN
jgi:hypothetical protein